MQSLLSLNLDKRQGRGVVNMAVMLLQAMSLWSIVLNRWAAYTNISDSAGDLQRPNDCKAVTCLNTMKMVKLRNEQRDACNDHTCQPLRGLQDNNLVLVWVYSLFCVCCCCSLSPPNHVKSRRHVGSSAHVTVVTHDRDSCNSHNDQAQPDIPDYS